MMAVDKEDLRRVALSFDGVTETGPDTFTFSRGGRHMIWPYPEKVHPKKARVLQYDRYCLRVADADDKEALLEGEPDVFFTTDHYNGYASVIVRLDALDEARLREVVEMAWEAAPLPTKLVRSV